MNVVVPRTVDSLIHIVIAIFGCHEGFTFIHVIVMLGSSSRSYSVLHLVDHLVVILRLNLNIIRSCVVSSCSSDGHSAAHLSVSFGRICLLLMQQTIQNIELLVDVFAFLLLRCTLLRLTLSEILAVLHLARAMVIHPM